MSKVLNHDESEHVLQQATIRVETDLNTITQVIQWFEQFNCPPLVYDLWVQGRIALVEGLTNAIQHAHKTLPQETPVDLAVKIFLNKIEIYVWDEGPAFDLEALLSQVDQQHPDPLTREAHWGGVLMKKLRNKYCWTIRYNCPADSASHRNCLFMQKVFS